MIIMQSARPCTTLTRYVRAYAHREARIWDIPVIEACPARLEPTLEFQFRDPFDVCFSPTQSIVSPRIVVVGLHTHLQVSVRLVGHIESFAIFFQPSGFSLLFNVPMRELTNLWFEGTSVAGAVLRSLWNELGENPTFSERVKIVERLLLRLAARAEDPGVSVNSADRLLEMRGMTRIDDFAYQRGISTRQFERKFAADVGLTPKLYARVARFQSALDAKVYAPKRSWLDIAHTLGYHDQMHMVHDFQALSGDTPGIMLARLGEMRPAALVAAYD